MAEFQKTTAIGETTQRFIEFVMMQAQNAAMFLGRLPNPQTGQPEVNLEFAKLFIDQLEMISEKTRGNLTSDESEVLNGVLADLRMAFVQAASGGGATPPPAAVEPPRAETPRVEPPPAEPAVEAESRKKFTKSYGA